MSNQFGRRSYVVVDEDAKPVESLRAKVTIEINGKVHTAVQLRAPGMVAVLVRPSEPDRFVIEMVEPGGKRFTDVRLPPEAGLPLKWQEQALLSDER